MFIVSASYTTYDRISIDLKIDRKNNIIESSIPMQLDFNATPESLYNDHTDTILIAKLETENMTPYS